jgi:putative endonuclease
MSRTQTTGRAAERRAEQLLTAAGLQLLQRNYRCRAGEIDLVMIDGVELVFVEVRYRRGTRFGGPLGSIDRAKQRRIGLAAAHYLQRHAWSGPCRFDVVGLDGASDRPEWIRDAFST